MKLKAGELGTALFDLVPCAVVLVDRDYNIVNANPAFRDNYGDWEANHCYEVFKRQHRPCANCAALQTFHDGKVRVTEEQGFDKEGRRTFFEVKTAPIRGADGQIEYVMEMTVDISKLKDLESRYQLLFDRVPCFITVVDRGYRIVDANWRQREAFGDTAGTCHQVYMQSAQPCADCPVRQSFEDGRVHVQQKQLTNKRGQSIHVMVHSAPLHDRSGKIEKVIEMATDISAMVEAREKLLHAEGEAAMSRAVEVLRTTARQLLAGWDEVLRLGFAPEQLASAAGRRVLEALRRRVEHLRTMLRLMGRYQLPDSLPGTIDANVLVGEVAASVGSTPGASTIPIRTSVADRTCLVTGDPEALRDCLACLVYEYVDICPLNPPADKVVLSVSRDEPGFLSFDISRQAMELVAENAAAPVDRGQGGLSMSLFLVRRAVENLGGSVEFCASGRRGLVFEVRLPGVEPG